jgi:hypothetical protein
MIRMQSNKASKKTRKADDAKAAVPEINAAEGTAKPRVSRSSKSKMQETGDTALASHRHKTNSPALEGVAEPANAPGGLRETENKTMAAVAGAGSMAVSESVAAPREISPEEVAKLAYSYFVERGYQHGYAEEDWLRAERELKSRINS